MNMLKVKRTLICDKIAKSRAECVESECRGSNIIQALRPDIRPPATTRKKTGRSCTAQEISDK